MSRMDNRSPEQFAKEIKERTAQERLLMLKYVDSLNTKGKGLYTFRDHGVDNSGDFIEKESDVTCAADFLLLTPEHMEHKIEIKFSLPNHLKFHLKIAQIKRYIEDDVCIIMFMNAFGKNERYCILTPAELQVYHDTLEHIRYFPWGNKLCICIMTDNIKWIEL